jgi:hypothetical protein
MTKTIANTETKLLIDDSDFAYKDGQMFRVWKTEKTFAAGCCMGKIRFVLDENGEELSRSLPLMGFTNGYEGYSKDEIYKAQEIAVSFDKLIKNKRY